MPKQQPDSGGFIQLYRTEGTSKKKNPSKINIS